MPKALKTINSKNKTNIRFIAAGTFQIEFFEIGSEEFFTIYRMNYGSEGGARYILVNLQNSSVARVNENEFHILSGKLAYSVTVKFKDKRQKVYVTRYLWGWLPFGRYGGKVSSAGLASLKANLSKYKNGMAA